MTGSFVRRKINVQIGIGLGDDGEKGMELYDLPQNLRITMSIEKVGGMSMGNIQGRIYGLSLDFMNKVSTLGLSPVRTRNNIIRVYAGDDFNGMPLAFQGTLQEAWHDFEGSPETFLFVSAYAGLRENLKAVPVSSYKGRVDAASVMADLAARMDLGFENNGVSVILTNPYLHGSALEQAEQCAIAGHFQKFIDDGKLIIVPEGKSRGDLVPLISATTGMKGYPSVGGQNNIRVSCIYKNDITFLSKIKVESIIKPANGTWIVYRVNHELESETDNGQWFTTMEAAATLESAQGSATVR